MNKIAFIGVGIMGRSMVRNLMKAGFELHIYARTRSKVEDVISEGATFHDAIADCVKDAEAVITIVGFPTDVEEVYFDAGNILDSAKRRRIPDRHDDHKARCWTRRSQKKEPKEASTYWTHGHRR